MKLIAALTREHEIFRRLLARVERALEWKEDAARTEIRESFLVLLPALDKHEEIESEVFGASSRAGAEGVRQIRSELARAHLYMKRLRRDVRRSLEKTDAPWPELRELVRDVIAELRGHFEAEEIRLWPRYAEAVRGNGGRAASRLVARDVRRLEDEIARNRLSVSDYIVDRR